MSMGLMRAVLGGDTEVAVVVATTPAGISSPLAVLVTPVIAAELALPVGPQPGSVGAAHVGPYDVDVVYDQTARPAALLISPWLFENLSMYARKLWVRH